MNFGIFPVCMMDERGHPDIFHFLYAGFYWIHSHRHEGAWQWSPIGRQGDGLGTVAVRDCRSRYHFVFKRQRSNANISPPLYTCRDGKAIPPELVPPELIDPAATECRGFDVDADGIPYVLLMRNGPAGNVNYVLGRRENEEWVFERAAPDYLWHPSARCSLACGPREHVFVSACVQTEQGRRMFLLVRQPDGEWHGSALPIEQTEPAAWGQVHMSADGKPVIVAGRIRNPNSWIKVYRFAGSLVGTEKADAGDSGL